MFEKALTEVHNDDKYSSMYTIATPYKVRDRLADLLIKHNIGIELEPVLLPCPFCGGEPEAVGDKGIIKIYCQECPCSISFPGVVYESDEDCVETWNSRTIKNK